VDKHVVKMILEYSQLLSTAHRVLDGTESIGISKTGSGRKQKRWILSDDRDSILYSATHVNHPSAIWVRQSNCNYDYLYRLLTCLCEEYTYRYEKIHKCESSGLVKELFRTPYNIPYNDTGLHPFTEPTPAMPDHCKVPGNSLQSYRNYYFMEKERMWSWSGKINSRMIPDWLQQMILKRDVKC